MAWVELSMRNTIIVPLVREGTRNHLQMAPVQTQPPPAPAPLFFLPPPPSTSPSAKWGFFQGGNPVIRSIPACAPCWQRGTLRSRSPVSPPCVPATKESISHPALLQPLPGLGAGCTRRYPLSFPAPGNV